MFYNIKNLLLGMLACFCVAGLGNAKAQGLVSLSEEAMFEDELDTPTSVPATDPIVANNQVGAPKVAAITPQAPLLPAAPVMEENVEAPLPEKAPLIEKTEPKGNIFEEAAAVDEPTENKDSVGVFGAVDSGVMLDEDLFKQMSEIEKKTALLNLELKRERLQNEVEAVKNQRKQALIAEQEKAEAQKMRQLEAQKKVEQELLQEKEKLRELDIKFEILRQEKVLDAYKNKMLEDTQKWIENNASFYKQIADLRSSKKIMIEDFKAKMQSLKNEAVKAVEYRKDLTKRHEKEVDDLQTQINILRKKVSALEQEKEQLLSNPFAGGEASSDTEDKGAVVSTTTQTDTAGIVVDEPLNNILSTLYAVAEIRGKGNELVAKLINRSGISFYVKRGTTLQSGHTVGEITTTYVAATKNGQKEYLYFAAGGVLPTETESFKVDSETSSLAADTESE